MVLFLQAYISTCQLMALPLVIHWSANLGLRSLLPFVLGIPLAGVILLVTARPTLLQTGLTPVLAALPLSGKAFFLPSTCSSSFAAAAGGHGDLLALPLSTLASTPNGGPLDHRALAAIVVAGDGTPRRAKTDPVVSRFLGAV